MSDEKMERYIEWLKKENGVLDEQEFLLDKNFLADMIMEIEESRIRRLVYLPEYKKWYLDEYLRKKRRKECMKKIAEKSKMKKELEISNRG